MIFFKFKIFVYSIAQFLLGKAWVNNEYLKYSVRNYKKQKIIFIHVPRTGGTSVSFAIFGKRNGHFSALEVRNHFGKDYFNSVYSFVVVRNPFERLVSAYQFIRSCGSNHGAVRPNKIFSLKAFESFESFVKTWLIFQPHVSIDLLFKPQYLFVTDEDGKLMVTAIFQIENSDGIKAEIGSVLGRPLNIARLNSTNHPHFTKYYNEELIELVFNYYRNDFFLFNYSRHLPA